MSSTLAAEAGLLVTAERRARIEAVERVRPDHAGAEPLRHPEDAGAFLGPDAGAQSVRRVVCLLDRFLRRPECEHRENGAEDLLLRDAVALRDIREDGGDEPVALLRKHARGLVDLGAFLDSGGNELLDLL